MKINELSVSNFRGISKTQKLIFNEKSVSKSVLIYGDNGTGKSSFLDAIELITQGTVQNRRTMNYGDWIFSSKSKSKSKLPTKICCKFDNGLNVEKDYVFDDSNKLRIVTLKDKEEIDKNISIPDFCHAPFVLRRKNIINFWEINSIERMKIFIPFSDEKNDIGYIPITEQEKIDRINKKRQKLKNKRNELLDKLFQCYNLDYKKENLQKKDDVFSKIKRIEHVKKLKNLKKKNRVRYQELKRLGNYYDEISGCNKSIKNIKRKSKQLAERKVGKFYDLKKIMGKISPEITNYFKEISPSSNAIDKIIVSVAEQTDVSLNFEIILSNGKKAVPEKYFSEANRDLLALLLYLEFIYEKQSEGQSKVLIMDDIFQSIDSTIRLNFARYLIKRFDDWQLILTTHDELWKEQLINLFRNHNKKLIQYKIKDWNLSDGPQIIKGFNNYDEQLKSVISNGDTVEICARSGYLLEYLCENLSMIIHSSIQRKRDDRYTIGDLWPGILKNIKRTPAKECFEKLNDFIIDRNLLGAHYNEWALGISQSEAREFGTLVLEAYYNVFYKEKGKWIKDIGEITGKEL